MTQLTGEPHHAFWISVFRVELRKKPMTLLDTFQILFIGTVSFVLFLVRGFSYQLVSTGIRKELKNK